MYNVLYFSPPATAVASFFQTARRTDNRTGKLSPPQEGNAGQFSCAIRTSGISCGTAAPSLLVAPASAVSCGSIPADQACSFTTRAWKSWFCLVLEELRAPHMSLFFCRGCPRSNMLASLISSFWYLVPHAVSFASFLLPFNFRADSLALFVRCICGAPVSALLQQTRSGAWPSFFCRRLPSLWSTGLRTTSSASIGGILY